MTSTPLGSDAWTNEPRYQDEYRARLDFVLGEVSILAIQHLGSSVRNGLECTISNNFSAGNFNLVKKITFVDGVQWIVRIRLPPISYFYSSTPKDEEAGSKVERRGSRIKMYREGFRSTKE
jgi:hypothetical protein